MVLRPEATVRGAVDQHDGVPGQEAGGGDPRGQTYAPLVWRGAVAVRAVAKNFGGYTQDIRFGAMRFAGHDAVLAVRGRGGLPEAEHAQARSDDAVHLRNLSDVQTGERRLDVPAAVLEVSPISLCDSILRTAVLTGFPSLFTGKSRGAAR